MPPRLPTAPSSSSSSASSVNSVVQQWERRVASPSTQQRPGSGFVSAGLGDARSRRPSMPPPAPSSGAGLRTMSRASLTASSPSSPSLSSTSIPHIEHGYITRPYVAVQQLDDEDNYDDDNDEKHMLESHIPLSNPRPSAASTNNIYVGGETARNGSGNTRKPARIWSSAWWPTWGLWPSAGVLVRRALKNALQIACVTFTVWIPGLIAILFYNALHVPLNARPTFIGVEWLWWSAWLSAAYAAAWLCWLLANAVPVVLRFVGRILAVSPSVRRLITYVGLTRRYLASLLLSLAVWLLFLGLVWDHFPGHEGVDGMLLDPLSTSANNTSTASSADTIIGTLFSASGAQSPAAVAAATSYRNHTDHMMDLVRFSRFLFGIMLSCALLWAQKLFIQSVANSFHKVTYADRITALQSDTNMLIALLANAQPRSVPVSFHTTAKTTEPRQQADNVTALDVVDAANEHVRTISGHGWHHFRNVISVQGKPYASILRSGSAASDDRKLSAVSVNTDPPFIHNGGEEALTPTLYVESSLEKADTTRALARRIFEAYAVATPSSPSKPRVITQSSVKHVFAGRDQASSATAKRAFAVLDRNHHGDCTWEETLQACVAIHRERVCLLASMHDVDSAVAKLDGILRGTVATLSCVVIVALLSTRFSTLIASLGTTLLGLSWLVSSTAQEALASIVWVFCKHPIDVGDMIVVPGLLSSSSSTSTQDALACVQGFTDGDTFVVQEVQLLSTVLRTTSSGKHVHVGNYWLAQKPLVNLRRSGPVDEPFVLSVVYETPFSTIERVRTEMAAWVATQRRDFRAGVEVSIESLDDQSRMRLVFSIRYKTDWQNAALRMRRRNRWISALKQVLARNNVRGSGSSIGSPTVGGHSGGEVQAFDLMDDERSDYVDRHRGNEDEKEGDVGDATTVRSRLNPALDPVHGQTATMYRQHSASTTQLSPATAAPAHWGVRNVDLELGGGGNGGHRDAS